MEHPIKAEPLAGGSMKGKGSFRHYGQMHAMLALRPANYRNFTSTFWLEYGYYSPCWYNRRSWHGKCNHCLNMIWALHVL